MLTAEGFIKKSYDEYLAELEQQARELFGADINLSENGSMGKFIRLQAYGRAEESELAEAIFLSGSVDSAEGLALDYVVKNAGMVRLQATKAIVTINLTVTPGKTINAGLIVETSGGIQFVTTADTTDSDNNGTITTTAEALIAGLNGNVPANTITIVNTPVAGLSGVNNPTAATGGRDKETDKELRDRHADLGANSLSSTVNGIRTTILNDVPGAQSVTVIENSGTAVDSGGRPANSFEAVVLGGAAGDIANAILKAKPAGIRAYGTQTQVVIDDSGNNQSIGFSFATQVGITVYCESQTNLSFPSNGEDLIRNEIVNYINGLGMGQSIIFAKLSSLILANVPGIDDIADLEIGRVGGGMIMANLYIAPTEVARISADNVQVVY